MDNLEITGGARIGRMKATWPFVTLKVSKDKLELNASIIGNLVFQPKDILSIEVYSAIPLIGQGIKINHRVGNYKSEVIFGTSQDPTYLINQIRNTGFMENLGSRTSESESEIIKQQQAGSFPLKKSVGIIAIVIWNLLLISDFIVSSQSEKKEMSLGYGTITALALLLTISVLSLISEKISRLLLKEGKSINDIRKFLYLLIGICVFMLTMILSFKFS